MIQANELRIGNYLNWDADHGCAGILRVEEIQEYNFLAVGLAKCQPTSQLEYEYEVHPIPITPDWLEKLGFEKTTGTTDVSYTKDIIRVFNKSEVYIKIGYDDEYLLPTEYVHQLQNLYFALTGEELIIKEIV